MIWRHTENRKLCCALPCPTSSTTNRANSEYRKQVRTVLRKRLSSNGSPGQSYSFSHSSPPMPSTPPRPTTLTPGHSQRSPLPPNTPPMPTRPTTGSPQSRRVSTFQRPQTGYMYVERPKTSLGFKPKSRPVTPGGDGGGEEGESKMKKKRFGSVRKFFKEL